MTASSTTGTVVGVNGNMIRVSFNGPALQNEVVFVRCGDDHLKAEIIRIQGQVASVQVFEDTKGVRVGDEVSFTGELLSVQLGPGLLGMIYDGLQNPLERLENRQRFFLQRGQYAPPLETDRVWRFHPVARVGSTVRAGATLGWVQERHLQHHILAPLGLLGTARVAHVEPEGDYAANTPIAILERDGGERIPCTMVQVWPVKRPIKAYKQRTHPRELMVTGCRIVDSMFPIGRGGTACIPGPFGAGKTVLQQLLSRHAAVDVVIIIACGERAGEVVETITEFPELNDPRTGGSLMDRTIIICNTSSMPVAAREASIYTGITLGEYYRSQGRDVLVLADSTSRWAQALREMSGRLEEIPGEEAFPAYLESRIAGLYERAGLVELRSGETGALTLIGTVSPAGGNFEEPVTQATLKVVGAFLGLSRKRSDERKYPAIDPVDSWSLYTESLHEDLNQQLDPHWTAMVQGLERVIQRGAEVGRMMTVVGEEGVSTDDLVVHLKAELLDAAYLQQNAFDEVDAATPIARQVNDLKLIYRAIAARYPLETKAKARAFFAKLQDTFYQKNYCSTSSEAYARYTTEIEAMLSTGTEA